MVVTDDAELAEDLRSLRNQGRDADGTWLNHVQLGFNYRMDDLSAAIGLAQVERRAELAALFRGRALLKLGQVAEATEEFRRAALLMPAAPLPPRWMAAASAGFGRRLPVKA